MADKAKSKPALLKTSAATDVKRSGGVVSITGLQSFRDRDILSIKQIKYKAEVSQVIAVGGGSYTPTGATEYTVQLQSQGYGINGNVLNTPKTYSYTTPVDITTLGATAALQREAIHAQLVTKINADSRNFVTALSLGTGTGFSITDDAGYYPARLNGASSGRTGATTVKALTNADGTGFINSTAVSTTTSAVYGFGVGARMINDTPVFANLLGNLISGELDAPIAADGTYATSGQQYDAFAILCNKPSEVPAVSGVQGFKVWEQLVYVDKGTGSSVTNLAGFKAFERAMQKLIFGTYATDPQSVIEWFDKDFVIQGPLGAVPVTTTSTNNSLAVYNKFLTPYGELDHRNIGTQTIVAPTQGPTGLLVDQDINTGDGNHYSPSLATNNSQQFIVGQTACSVVCRVVFTAVTGSNFQIGFHEKNVYFTDFNDYVNLATVGTLSTTGELTTRGILANAATVTTSSATLAVNAVSSEFRVNVAIDGTVTCFVDGVSYPIYSAGTTPLVFAAGTILVPFFQQTSITGTAGVVNISSFVSVADNTWKID